MSILNEQFTVIVLTETWLCLNINNNEFIDNRYIVYRKNRSCDTSHKLREEGVLIAVLKFLSSSEIPVLIKHQKELWFR